MDDTVLKKLDDNIDDIEVPVFEEVTEVQKFQNIQKMPEFYERHPDAHPKGKLRLMTSRRLFY